MKFSIKIDNSNTIRYYLNNLLHRDNGPAVEFAEGDKWWYKNGLLHRTDGPAVEYPIELKFWYLNNICYGCNSDFSPSSWKSFVNTFIFS